VRDSCHVANGDYAFAADVEREIAPVPALEDRLRYAATCPVSGVGGDLGDDLLLAASELTRLKQRLEVAECWTCRHFGREKCNRHAALDLPPSPPPEPIVCPTCKRIEARMGERWATELADALDGAGTLKKEIAA